MKNLVLSCGGTLDPIVTSIEKIKPDNIIFIASKETASTVDDIKELTKDVSEYDFHTLVLKDPEDLIEVFETSCGSKEFLKQGDIYVDYTGGTKSMSAGLAMAFFETGIKEYVYIGGNKRTKEGVGVVKSGAEKPVFKVDPARLYCLSIAKKIEPLFNAGLYRLTDELLKKEIPRSGDDLYVKELKKIQELVRSLCLWDSMNYKRSYANMRKYINSRPNTNKLFSVEIPDSFQKHLKSCSDRNPRSRISDLIDAAKRRKKNEEHDEAVLRIYRTIEFVGQTEFKKTFNLETREVKCSDFIKHFPDSKHNEYRGKYEGKNGARKFSLKETYEALCEKGNSIGKKYFQFEEEFREFNNKRNLSVLAHGFKPCGKEDVQQGFELIKKLLQGPQYIYQFQKPEIKFFFGLVMDDTDCV